MPKGFADSKEYALRLSAEEIRRYRSKAEHAARTEGAAWADCGVNPGARVLDLGCGPGAILPEVAARVSPGGLVVGIDQDPDAVATAAALAQEARLVNVSVRQGSAIRTGLDPDSFDVIMIRNVLVHAGQQAGKIVGHAASLLRPGGCLYLADIDGTAARWDAIDSGLVDLYRRFEDFLVATRGADLSIGPKLGSYLRAAGLDIFMRQAFYQTVNPVPDGGAPWAAREAMVHAGFASADDVDLWEKAISRTAANPDSVVFVPTFSAAGRRREHGGTVEGNRAMIEVIGAGFGWTGPGNDLAARFGRDAARAGWFYGFRLAIKADLGSRVIRAWAIVPAAVSERDVAMDLLTAGPAPRDLLAGKGFSGRDFAAQLAAMGTAVLVPPDKKHRAAMSSALLKVIAEWRNRIETTFSEITIQMELARHGAHTLWGLLTRTAATIAAHTLKLTCLADA